ncbi:MAG: DUF1987 domain-containing protein [Bacteroidales bacterium]|nr:DUF1987 domain-containing protein [Bacteroidales bacterium]
MEALILEKTEDTPGIVLDPANGNFKITDRSLPENANGFYAPIFEWLDKYIENPDSKVEFVFSLEYFNTASAKQIAKVLLLLEKLSKKTKVLIIWRYKAEDTDMQSSGVRYSKLLDVEFELQEVK